MKKIIILILGILLLSSCSLITPMTRRDHEEFERERDRQEEPYVPHPRDFERE